MSFFKTNGKNIWKKYSRISRLTYKRVIRKIQRLFESSKIKKFNNYFLQDPMLPIILCPLGSRQPARRLLQPGRGGCRVEHCQVYSMGQGLDLCYKHITLKARPFKSDYFLKATLFQFRFVKSEEICPKNVYDVC